MKNNLSPPPPCLLACRLLPAIILLFVFFSCESENSITEFSQSEHVELVLTVDQIDLTGDLHNEYLAKAVQNFDFDANKPESEMLSQIQSIGIEGFDLDYISEDYFENQKDNFKAELTSQGRFIIERTEEEMNTIQNLDDFVAFVEIQEKITMETTAGSEQSSIMIFLNVSKKSAEFWLPIESGGSGVGYSFLEEISLTYRGVLLERTSLDKAPEWVNSVIKADGYSAAGGFLVYAISTAVLVAIGSSVVSGGLTGAAITAALYVIIGESAVASGIAAIELIP
ncbi:MAG: hypothetical protein AB8H12_23860 [Lewinella sp.]